MSVCAFEKKHNGCNVWLTVETVDHIWAFEETQLLCITYTCFHFCIHSRVVPSPSTRMLRRRFRKRVNIHAEVNRRYEAISKGILAAFYCES